MKNKHFQTVRVLVFVPTILFSYCKEETALYPGQSGEGRESIRFQGSNENQSRIITDSSYMICGIDVDKFSSGCYHHISFDLLTGKSVVRPYHINDDGHSAFGTVDNFSFEFAGYVDRAHTARLWYKVYRLSRRMGNRGPQDLNLIT